MMLEALVTFWRKKQPGCKTAAQLIKLEAVCMLANEGRLGPLHIMLQSLQVSFP